MIQMMFLDVPLTIDNRGEIHDAPWEIARLLKDISPGCGARPDRDKQYFDNIKEMFPNEVTLVKWIPYTPPGDNMPPGTVY